MRVPFYIKIFLAFMLFSFILLLLFTLLFKNFYEMDLVKKEHQNIKESLILKQQIFDEYIASINTQMMAIHDSKIFNEFMQNKTNEDEMVDFFKLMMQSNNDVIQMKILSFTGKEIIRVNKTSQGLQKVSADELQNKIMQDYCKEVRALQTGEMWYSNFDVNKERGEISYPITFVMRFVLKTHKGFLSVVVNVNHILDKIHKVYSHNSFIVDNEGNFILHKDAKYHWSKYFISNQTLYKLYNKEAKQILTSDSVVTEEFMSQRIYINSQDYMIVLTQFDKNAYESYFKTFKEYFLTLLIVGFIIAVILALIFSEPIAKLNKKTEEDNKNLDLTIKKNSEELLESLNIIDKHVMSIRMDKEGIITEVSSAFCDFSGFSKGELLGHHHKMLVHPDMSKEEYDGLWKILKQGKTFFTELKGIKKDGGFYWVESHIEPIFDEYGDIIGFNAIRNNITDKKIIENLYSDINYQVQQYNAIFQNAHSGIGLIDLQGNFKKVNFMFSELLGYSSSELLQMSCFDIVHKNSKNFLHKIFIEAQEIGSISNIEKIFMHKEGMSIHLEMSLNLLPDKNYFVVVVNSLEDKRKLQELNQNLELRIKEEVQKSRQKDQLHQQEQIENIKLKSIGSLAAGITHEINTPLTYVKGNFEMMGYDIEDLPPSEIKTRMQEDSLRIKEGINRIANIVESMREISQSSNEAKEKVNIYSTIITALTMTYNRSKQISRIYLNHKLFNIDDINKNELQFMCEVQKQRVEQVWIVIIINNALDELAHCEDYEKRVLNIFIEEQNEEIVISFEDNAGGIKPEILKTLFEPFISSKTHSGMGVGLNISKKIIEHQNGKIMAFNKNNGAVFEVRLKKCE
ncbi:MAG: PAS domain S-box protein [Arcobacteraceae bacterium]|nr:PAS domain S-box protein [Arcobacteraceae bacterium]